MLERPHFIPRNRRANLSKYKYSGEDHSIISRYVLTPYWNRLVTFVPMSVAPNLITLTGLVFVMLNFASLLAFQPTMACSHKPSFVSKAGSLLETSQGSLLDKFKSFVGLSNFQAKCPSGWLYLSFALGLWIYQSLDAIDGKQARRTGTSGPLGELFDHGCDALNTTVSQCDLLFKTKNGLTSELSALHEIARRHSCLGIVESRAFLVDGCFSSRITCQLLPHDLGRIPYRHLVSQ
ncbi:hypothetical protein PGTUg99_008528 [Puccinia graminis f. sp. tritici]|uniref:Uncharacterized protein n=1 Tax=Puccinia graminis f. sp. tritici TaxID=56615 RepID=A0A5B0P4H2_PUCGR|nr:hypothetical protein PGTUg99_008528 [Puccinia graminis f. sp. tritici]